MERRKEIRSTMFKIVAWDVALLLLFMVAFLPAHLKIAAATYLPTVLIFNVVMLRRNQKTAGTPTARAGDGARSGRSSLYICSGMFFAGTLYGLLTISQGELPRTTLPLLLVPLLLAVYCLKMARRITNRTPKSDATITDHSR
ncbi:hypothetical protein ACOBR2_05410 [Telmatobacter bradus]|uniref:hypothetical protein n=1 Tax=Telmatobacter bradus TaxID=474953 RepID=UPI003B42DA0D